MATLALFGAGRILLHLLAALGNGSFRFHAAGIKRELSRFASTAALLEGVDLVDLGLDLLDVLGAGGAHAEGIT